MFLSDFLSGTPLYKQFDVVKLSDGRLAIISMLYPSYTVTSQYKKTYTYHAYALRDYSNIPISYENDEYTIKPFDKNWSGNLNVRNVKITDYFLTSYIPYITNVISNQDQWKLQFIGIYWIKLINKLTKHVGDDVLKTGALISNDQFISYLNSANLTLEDLKGQDFYKIFSGQVQPQKYNVTLPGIGILKTSTVTVQSDLALIYINNQPNLGKLVPQDILDKMMAGQKPPISSTLSDLFGFGLKVLMTSKAPVINIVMGFINKPQPKVSKPHAYILIDGTPYFYVNIDGKAYDTNNQPVKIEPISQERANYLEPQLLEVIKAAQILGKTSEVVNAINKLNSGNILTPSELSIIKKPIEDILTIQRNFIIKAQSLGISVSYDYQQKLQNGIPLSNEEGSVIQKQIEEKQKIEQQKQLEKQQLLQTSLLLSTQIQQQKLILPNKPNNLSTSTIIPQVIQSVQPQITNITNIDEALKYFNTLPKEQQLLILGSGGILLLFLLL